MYLDVYFGLCLGIKTSNIGTGCIWDPLLPGEISLVVLVLVVISGGL